MSYEPKGNGPYDSRAEEAIDWYQHFMSIEAKDLLRTYTTRKGLRDHEVSEACEMAFEARTEEMLEVLD